MNKLHLIRMVTIAIMAVLLAPSITSAQAQFGIRGGLNATTVSFDNLANKSERYGFHIGAFLDLPVIGNFISLVPEVSYSVKGTAFEPLNKRQTLNMNYVDFLLPVAFKLGAFEIQVGPFASYLISTPDYTIFDDTRVIIDAFDKTDAGLTAGLSYNFKPLFIAVRYNQGLVDITKDNVRVFLGSGKTAVGQVSLGVKF
jgi:Outer membrane protein beta-barrel domain